MSDWFGRWSFLPNEGQWPEPIDALGLSAGFTAVFTPAAVVFSLHSMRELADTSSVLPRAADPIAGQVMLRFHGAANLVWRTGERGRGFINFLSGREPSSWRHGVHGHASLDAASIYEGIDLHFYRNGKDIEFDFELEPYADPKLIGLEIVGADALTLATDGALVVTVGSTSLRFGTPVVFSGTKDGVSIPVSYRLHGERVVSFDVADYDRSLPLIIDPAVLGFRTFIGSAATDVVNAVATTPSGEICAVGRCDTALVPPFTLTTSGVPQTVIGPTTGAPLGDAFVACFNRFGTCLWVNVFGAGGQDIARDVAVDANGDAYVIGNSTSVGAFPTVGPQLPAPAGAITMGFFGLFANGGTPIMLTPITGGVSESATGIVVNGVGDALITGATQSPALPTSLGAANTLTATRTGAADAFVMRVSIPNPAVITVPWATTFGSAGSSLTPSAISVGKSAQVTICGGSQLAAPLPATTLPSLTNLLPNALVLGNGAFVARFAPTPGVGSLIFSSMLTGTINAAVGAGNLVDASNDIVVDSNGQMHIVGTAAHTDFVGGAEDTAMQPTHGDTGRPAATGVFDGYLLTLDYDSSTRTLSKAGMTFLGGIGNDSADAVTVRQDTNLVIGGSTPTGTFLPLAAPAAAPLGGVDGFVVECDFLGITPYWSTLVGGAGADGLLDLSLDDSGNDIAVGGFSASTALLPGVVPSPVTVSEIPANVGANDGMLLTLRLPEINVSPSTLRFRTVAGTTQSLNVAINNVGLGTLQINSITLSPSSVFLAPQLNGLSFPFSLDSVLLPSNSFGFQVLFSPPTTGNFSASITVTSDDSDEPVVIVLLTGVGL